MEHPQEETPGIIIIIHLGFVSILVFREPEQQEDSLTVNLSVNPYWCQHLALFAIKQKGKGFCSKRQLPALLFKTSGASKHSVPPSSGAASGVFI